MPKIVIFIFFILLNISVNSYGKDEYFRTLRNDTVNLRQGPSFDYPVKIFYKKKFLPVLIQDSSSNFRKIRDHENNSGWIHISQLSKKRAAIVTDDDLLMFERATIYSNPVAILKKGRLVKINKCKEGWCKVKSDKFKGWIKNESLWGLF
jgi:SH3-like domain-containing protein